MQNGGGGAEDSAFKLARQPASGALLADREHDIQSVGLKGQQVADQGVELARCEVRGAAVAVGVAGLFMETHPDPSKAMSDGPNAVPLRHMKALLETLVALDSVTKKTPFLENNFQ